MSNEFRLTEPCTRAFLHHPHVIHAVTLSNALLALLCPGAGSEPPYKPLSAVE